MIAHLKPVEDHPGYRISSDGIVESCWSRYGRGSRLTGEWRPLKPILRRGYLTVNLTRGGAKKAHRIHRLVMQAFVGPCPPGCVVCHVDGDPKNNHLDNLRHGTARSNSEDTLRHGTRRRGEALPQSKLEESEVKEIRKLRVEGVSAGLLAQRYGVSRANIAAIMQRRSWRHLP